MPRRRALPPDAEVAIAPKMRPLVLRSDGSIKTLSMAFLADLENDWREHGPEIFETLRTKYPQVYFMGLVSLARVMRIELGKPGEFDKPKTPEEIIDKLEERIGPKGRVNFENFVRQINQLQAEQQLEQQQQQQQEQERRRQRRQHHAVSPSGDAGSGG